MECIFWGNDIWGMDLVCVSLLYPKHFIGLSSSFRFDNSGHPLFGLYPIWSYLGV